MLFAPPLEIIDLIENVFDDEGYIIGEKISDQATPKQRELFEQYKKNCEDIKRRSFRVDLSDKTYNPVDGWKIK